MLTLTTIKKFSSTYRQSTHGIAALEFALVTPFLLASFYATVEFSNYNMQVRRAQIAVDLSADFMSTDDNDQFTMQERWQVEDIWAIVNPTAHNSVTASYWASGYSRALASVEFVIDPTCTQPGCSYEPNVLWSFQVGASGVESPVHLSCDVEVVGNSVTLKGSEIPEGFVGRGAIIVADYTFQYQPIFNNSFVKKSQIHVNSIRKTRGGETLNTNGSHTTWC